MVEHGRETTVNYYPQILQKLAPLFANTKAIPNIMDNACGAVARMLLTFPQQLPLDQVLPVFLKALPLKKDFEENKTVYNSIFQLFRSQNTTVMSNLPLVLTLFAKVLGSEDVEQEIQIEIINMLKTLFQQHGGQLEQIVKALPTEEQLNLQKFLSQI